MSVAYDFCYVSFRDIRHAVLGSFVLGALSGLIGVLLNNLEWEVYFTFATISFTVSVGIWVSNLYISVFLNRRYSEPRQVRTQLVLQLIWSSIAAFLFTNGVFFVCKKYIGFELGAEGEHGALLFSILITLLINLAYIGGYFFNLWKESLIRQEHLQMLHTMSQLEALKAQVDPHFLFNALTTLSELIFEDQHRASEYVERLSQVYRYILDHSKESMSTLQEELRFLKAYAFLLQTRYGEALTIEWPHSAGPAEGLVPALATQVVLENVIKHNIIDSERPMLVEVTILNARLHIRNRLQLKSNVSGRRGTGIDNLRDRYRLLTGMVPVFSSDALHYFAELPITSPSS